MARPIKTGVDYFPLDVNTDKKFKLIEAKFGIVGFGVIVKLLQRIYAENGYYYNWDDDAALITAAENSCQKYPLSPVDVNDIVDEAIKRGIFDNDMYLAYNILTSKGIQRRYFEAVKKRLRVDVKKEYLLLSASEIPINVYINGVNVDTNSKKVDDNTQTKLNKSKLNKTKVKETTKLPPGAVPQELIDFYQNNISRNFITPRQLDNIAFWLERVDADVIKWAMEQAVDHTAPNWSYIESILRNHFDAGRTTLAAVKDANRSFKAHKNKQESVYDDSGVDYDEIEKIMRGKM